MSEKAKPEIRRAAWMAPLFIFACAFAARMIFVLQAKDSPFWRVPLVDARTYHELALEMLNTSWLAPLPTTAEHCTPYFQPPLYQAFLALIYLLSGKSVMAAIIVQYLLGSISCVLAYLIGRRLFSHRVGFLAGIAMALTATQIYYDGRLLPVALITILNLTIILLALKQLDRMAVWRWPVIGLLTGLSAIARPDIVLFLPVLLVWMWRERDKLLPKRATFWICVLMVMAAIPIGLVALRNRTVGKDSVLISWNGGVNFLIGNNPSMERTVAILPGIEWEGLINEPMMRTGSTKPSVWDRYFYRTALDLMWKTKRATVRNF
ncbi:MAG: glycosyltransferase family 39 protein, partial [Armatimonadetes bacterium]|nr:glycosyltransferase family 39 protein [Armatimonadota bacterium]